MFQPIQMRQIVSLTDSGETDGLASPDESDSLAGPKEANCRTGQNH